jgi:hypothetical protein
MFIIYFVRLPLCNKYIYNIYDYFVSLLWFEFKYQNPVEFET